MNKKRVSDRKMSSKPMTKQDRRNKIKKHLKPMQGHSVYNRNIRKDVFFTGKGIDEIGEQGKYSSTSMKAAMDTSQFEKATKQRVSKAKPYGKQKAMKLEKMITMKGKYNDKATKVLVGITGNDLHKAYSVTIVKGKRHPRGR